ncbi:MAG: hypothetical protein AB1782_00235 [Cyanobacteriota bacterium]
MNQYKYDLNQMLTEIEEDKKLNDTSPKHFLSQDEILEYVYKMRKAKKIK